MGLRDASASKNIENSNLTPFLQTEEGPSGSPGKLVVLESRTELDCLIEFINDKFDDPAKLRYALNFSSPKTAESILKTSPK